MSERLPVLALRTFSSWSICSIVGADVVHTGMGRLIYIHRIVHINLARLAASVVSHSCVRHFANIPSSLIVVSIVTT